MAAARAAQLPPAALPAREPSKPVVPAPVTATDTKIEAALDLGKRLRKLQPCAASVRYDRKARLVVVNFTNGTTFSFPALLAQGLSGATIEQLSDVRVLKHGAGLRWESLDVDLSVPGLFNQVFGTRKLNARLAGQVKSPAKTEAARSNGAKGGRPRKPVSGKSG